MKDTTVKPLGDNLRAVAPVERLRLDGLLAIAGATIPPRDPRNGR